MVPIIGTTGAGERPGVSKVAIGNLADQISVGSDRRCAGAFLPHAGEIGEVEINAVNAEP